MLAKVTIIIVAAILFVSFCCDRICSCIEVCSYHKYVASKHLADQLRHLRDAGPNK